MSESNIIVTALSLLGGACLSVVWLGRGRAWDRTTLLSRFVLVLAAVLLAELIVLQICNGPLFGWNARRLVGSVATAMGQRVISPFGTVPMISGLAGPFPVYFFLPSAFFSTPDGVVWCGMSLAVIGSMAASFLILSGTGTKGSAFERVAICVLFGLLVFRSRALHLSFGMVHLDAPAIVFCSVATFLLLRAPNTRTPALFAICLLGWAAFHSKITFLPFLPSVCLFIALRDGWKRGALAGAIAIVSFVLVSGVLVGVYGWQSIFDHGFPPKINWVANLTVPAGFAITPMAKTRVLMSAVLEVFYEYFWVIAAVALGILYKEIARKENKVPFSRFLEQNVWVFPLLTALIMFPAALIGRVKAGGDFNTQTPTVFFLMLGACQCLFDVLSRARLAKQTYAALLGLCALSNVGTLHSLSWPLKDLKDNPSQVAFAFSQKHPEEAYFPEFPLSQLLAEKKIYHSGTAVGEYLSISPEMIREVFPKFLPKKMKWVAYQNEVQVPIQQMLPAFKTKVELPELKDWIVYSSEPLDLVEDAKS